jgi:hypothetical protein
MSGARRRGERARLPHEPPAHGGTAKQTQHVAAQREGWTVAPWQGWWVWTGAGGIMTRTMTLDSGVQSAF